MKKRSRKCLKQDARFERRPSITDLSQTTKSWLRPTLTNISLALKSSCRMMSASRQASTSGLVSLRDSERQWLMSRWAQAAWSLCSDSTATHRKELGAFGGIHAKEMKPEEKKRNKKNDSTKTIMCN